MAAATFTPDEQNRRPCVLVTGASEGIGKALAEHLGRLGHTLILTARNETALDTLAKTIPSEVHVLVVDLLEPVAPDHIAVFAEARGLYIDVIINNAGVGFGGRFDQQCADDVETTLAVNIGALVKLTHRFLPSMRARCRGGLINIASVAGFMPGPHQALYFASKAFVLSFSQAIAAECSGSNVHIMAAAPGPVETRIHNAMRTRWSYYKRLFPSYQPEKVAKIIWNGFNAGHRVLVPGRINNLAALASVALPKELLVPLVGFLVRPRFRNGKAV